MAQEATQRWKALESNPGILSDLISELGVKVGLLPTDYKLRHNLTRHFRAGNLMIFMD
jgi:hypothetical protein